MNDDLNKNCCHFLLVDTDLLYLQRIENKVALACLITSNTKSSVFVFHENFQLEMLKRNDFVTKSPHSRQSKVRTPDEKRASIILMIDGKHMFSLSFQKYFS